MLSAIHRELQLSGALGDYIVHTNDRPGADTRYAIADAKLRQDLGWSPQQTFDQDLGETVQWYLHQEEWWRAIKDKPLFVEHYQRQEKANYY